MTQVVQTLEQHYYLAKLLGYDYQIKFKRGHSSVIADALLRITPAPDSTCLVLHVPQLDFMNQLRESLQASETF